MSILGIDPGKHHIGMCLYNPSTRRIINWGLYKVDDTSVRSFLETFKECIMNIIGDEVPDTIVIERQPPKNASMSRISHYMHVYLAMSYPHTEISVVPPSRRIRYLRNASPGLLFDTYSQRKKSSVEFVSQWVESHNSSWKEWFHDQSKKDDCAESFLLCISTGC